MTISVGERATTMVVALATSKALRQRAALVASSFSRSRFVFLDIFRCRQLRRRRGPFFSGASFGEIILPEHSRRHRTIRPPRFCHFEELIWVWSNRQPFKFSHCANQRQIGGRKNIRPAQGH